MGTLGFWDAEKGKGMAETAPSEQVKVDRLERCARAIHRGNFRVLELSVAVS